MRRTTKGLTAATAVLTAGAAVAAAVGFGGTDRRTADARTLPPATATITRQTLVDAQTESGTLTHGTTTTVTGALPGTITALAAADAVVRRGGALYRVDDQPIILMYGALPAYRTLAPGVSGADVKQFERNLRALGYDDFTVDEDYTAATATAVKQWQDDLGLPETGTVDRGRVVFAGGPVRVDARKVAVGDGAQPGQAVLTLSGTAPVVTVELEVADRRLARVGATVTVELPDGKRVTGRITKAETVVSDAKDDNGDPTTETTIEVTVAIRESKALTGYDEASVDVEFTASQRRNVLTVPVAALLALAEGGYGVEIVANGSSRIVAVRTGLFASGRVEISGAGLAENMTVGVPT